MKPYSSTANRKQRRDSAQDSQINCRAAAGRPLPSTRLFSASSAKQIALQISNLVRPRAIGARQQIGAQQAGATHTDR